MGPLKFYKALSLDILVSTARRLLMVMALFTLLRAVFYWYNIGFFPNISPSRLATIFWGGLRFDVVAIFYTNILYIFLMTVPCGFRYNLGYQRFAKGLFIITNGIALGLNCIDIAYFQFTLRRTSRSVLEEFGNESNMGGLSIQFFLDYWYLFLLLLVLVFLLERLYGKHLQRPKELAPIKLYLPVGIVLLCATIVIFVGGVRGGYEKGLRPITLSNAGSYVERPLQMAIVLNTPFSIFKTLEITPLERLTFFDDPEEAARYYTPVHIPPKEEVFQPRNVVVLILESFGAEYIGALNGLDKGYTPFLDSLIGESLSFHYSFANGKKSIDAMPSVLASIPSLIEPFVLTPYAGNEINTLASLLGEKEYATAFFHGAPNGSMGFRAFSKIAGYDRYVGKEEYGNDDDFDGNWGIWDEEFLQFFATEMNGMPQPFLTTVFTVSSHHPYKVPQRYEGVFPKGDLRIHECIGYSDHALRKFFATAATMPWFDNTLFVITADHTNMETKHLQFQTSAGVFRIPVFFYMPDGSLKQRSERLAQQIDIMPTVLGLLHYDRPYIAFGNDLLSSDPDSDLVINYNGFYQTLQGDHLLQFHEQESTALFHFKTDTFLTHNLLNQEPDVASNMELQLKSFIQQYNQRLIDNSLTVEKRTVTH